MSTLFLFGAGASRFSGPCRPEPPPLGNALFEQLQVFSRVAASVSDDIAVEFRRDFETGMARFRETTRSHELAQFTREMARYFLRFEPGPGNLYDVLVHHIVASRRMAVLATLNYDLLIEHVILSRDLAVTYGRSPLPKDGIRVLKLHGSANFILDVPGTALLGDIITPTGERLIGGNFIPVTPEQARIWMRREDSLAPAMSMYALGKQTPFGTNLVADQQAGWREQVARATQIIVCGVRVVEEDKHVWAPLARSTAPLFYIDPDPAPYQKWAARYRRRAVYHLARTFEEALPRIVKKLS
jgi:hypothetical protein